ncbi:MAG: prolipoprotein diacylglyceryl transferase [Oscillospiraceae bacterium]|nr:prolipoprotein diacylglyceryl transferase [Oscillospiraceae bacterium]
MTELGKIIFPNLGGLEFNPPKGFMIGSFVVHFYGVIIGLGLLLAAIYGLKRAKQFGIKQDDIYDGILWILPFAVICARLYYVWAEPERFDGFWDVLNIRQGGLAIYGGVIGAAVGIALFSKYKKINMFALLDLVALGFMIGQSVGRWGNFINREAFGSYCDNFLAMQIQQSNLDSLTAGKDMKLLLENAVVIDGISYVQVHPTFFYESMWNAAGFVLLHFLSKKRQYDGQIALGYMAWYGLGRALIEGLRMDSLYWGSFRASQLLAAVTCLVAVVVLLLKMLKKQDRSKLYVNYVNKMDAAAAAAEQVISAHRESE